MNTSEQSSANSSHIQGPICCTLPETNNASDFLGSFVSLKDYTWIKLGICIILAGQSMVWGLAVNVSDLVPFSEIYWILHGILAISAFVVLGMSGWGLIKECITSLRHLKLGIESLFMVSLLGALGGSLYATTTGTGDIYYEVVIVVIVIYSFGRKIGQVSKEKAVVEANRFKQQFNQISIVTPSGEEASIPYCELNADSQILVRPGQPICADGIISSGYGFVKETPLTGEPHPVLKKQGDQLRAGTWSLDGTFQYKASSPNGERTIDHILERVESSISDTKSMRQVQAEKWIQWFVVFVCTIALSTGILWSVLESVSAGWLNSMSVLLVACPCALGLATPLAIWTGLWQLSRYGIVSRSSHLIDSLAHTKHIFFDKTGTITESKLSIGKIILEANCPWDENSVLQVCRELENKIDHPIARAFDPKNIPSDLDNSIINSVSNQRWEPGKGVTASLQSEDGSINTLKLGTPAWICGQSDNATHKTIVLAMDDTPIARINLVESLRDGVEELLQKLPTSGIRSTILTGDPHPQWTEIAHATVRAGLNPMEKAKIIDASTEKGEYPIFIGDGINDLDAMTSSHASISINDGGTALTQSSSSAILIGSNLAPIHAAILLAKRIDHTLKTNLMIAAGYNLIGISLAVAGLLHPVASVLIMIISSLLVTFRAIQKAEEFSNQA